jgi:rubrerythrin
VKNNLLHIFGLGLRAKAADAETSPEELAEMAADVGKVKDTDPDLFEVTEGRDGKRGKDGTRRGKDAPTIDPVDKDIEPADDKRRAMHDALDKLYDGKVKDTDIGELKALFDQYLGEEAAEPEHQTEDADPAELEELLGGGEVPDAEDTEAEPGEEPGPSGEENLEDAGEEPGGEAECAHCGTMHDAENCPSCGCMDKKTRAKDRARAADGVAATLRMFRPFVARSNDQAMKKVFNTALGTLTKRSRARVGDYGAFAGAARTRSKDVGHDPNPTRRRAADASQPTQDEKLQAYYDERLKGGK